MEPDKIIWAFEGKKPLTDFPRLVFEPIPSFSGFFFAVHISSGQLIFFFSSIFFESDLLYITQKGDLKRMLRIEMRYLHAFMQNVRLLLITDFQLWRIFIIK